MPVQRVLSEAARRAAGGDGGTLELITRLNKEVALMRAPEVPEDVRRILRAPAELMEQAAARLDHGQSVTDVRPRPVWSIVLSAFLFGAAVTSAAAWFLTQEEAAHLQAKAPRAAVAPAASQGPIEDPLLLRLETELGRPAPSR